MNNTKVNHTEQQQEVARLRAEKERIDAALVAAEKRLAAMPERVDCWAVVNKNGGFCLYYAEESARIDALSKPRSRIAHLVEVEPLTAEELEAVKWAQGGSVSLHMHVETILAGLLRRVEPTP